MFKHLLLAVSLFPAFNSPAAAQAISQDALEALNAAAAGAGEAQVTELPADKKWGVSYVLHGALTVPGEKVFLNTPDGRVFKLDLPLRKARRRAQAAALPGQAPPGPGAGRQPLRAQGRQLALAVQPLPAGGQVRPGHRDHQARAGQGRLFRQEAFRARVDSGALAAGLHVREGRPGGANSNESQALVLTIEAFLREGQVYDLKAGLKKNFGIVWLLTTWEDYATRTAQIDQAR